MDHPMRAAALAPAAVLALALGVSGAVMGPAPSVLAEPGYRVCGVYESASGGGYGTGLVVKIAKDDRDNATCTTKNDYMVRHYASAYPASTGGVTFAMVTCESFKAHIAYDGDDPCFKMRVNGIYRYTSAHDAEHPVAHGELAFWHD